LWPATVSDAAELLLGVDVTDNDDVGVSGDDGDNAPAQCPETPGP
jgi:hypothetical protein